MGLIWLKEVPKWTYTANRRAPTSPKSAPGKGKVRPAGRINGKAQVDSPKLEELTKNK